MTVGLSGLEQTYQDDAGRHADAPPSSWSTRRARRSRPCGPRPGSAGTPVRTTIDSQTRRPPPTALAAQHELRRDRRRRLEHRRSPRPRRASGRQRAAAARRTAGRQAAAGHGVQHRVRGGTARHRRSARTTPLPCQNVANVGGQTFTYQPGPAAIDDASPRTSPPGAGRPSRPCRETLTARSSPTVERSFGIGTPWKLRVPAFSGSAAAVSGEADVAAQATGTGGVLMSPLGMAMVAAEVDGRHRALAGARSPLTRRRRGRRRCPPASLASCAS